MVKAIQHFTFRSVLNNSCVFPIVSPSFSPLTLSSLLFLHPSSKASSVCRKRRDRAVPRLHYLVHPRLDQRPSQQTCCGDEKHHHNSLIFQAITLEAGGEDVFFAGILANGEVVIEAEGAVTVCTGQLMLRLLVVLERAMEE